MPRIARVVIPGVPHHVTQRGNNRQDVFFVESDRDVYLDLLREHCEYFRVDLLGYCLMTNHVHVIAVPREEWSLAKAMGRTHWKYTQLINHLHGRLGHLWQNRFFSCPLDEKHAVAAMRYVECNPVRAGVVRVPWRYGWSSAAAHVGERNDESGVLDLGAWGRRYSTARWREMLREKMSDEEVDLVRRYTHRGRPLGSDSFLSKVERLVGRRLRARPVGRPKGSTKRGKNR